MSRRRGTVVLGFLVLFFSVVVSGLAQIQLPGKLPKIPIDRLPSLRQIPGLDRILGKETPITTSLRNAVTEVAFLDPYEPANSLPMGAAAREEDGSFLLNPGAWHFEAVSYCLHAGTHGPGGGEGYLYAPLAGPKAPIVRKILQRSVDHPEISQTQVQTLLWAIIARTNLSKMSRQHQLTASRLLTPRELFELNGGALGLVPEEMKERAFANLPPAVRQIVEAENKLRGMLTEVNSNFEELERVAVLAGAPPPTEGDRSIPRGRWSYHPEGYFIRFIPSGYSRTHVDLYVPEPFAIDRDEHGNIVRIADAEGNEMDIAYDRASASIDGAVNAHSIRAVLRRADVESTSPFTAWTLTGIPAENKRASLAAGFPDLPARYNLVRARKQQFDALVRNAREKDGKKQAADESSLRDLLDLASLYDALGSVPESDPRATMILEAWQSTFQRRVGARQRQIASLDDQGSSDGTGGKTMVDPTGNVGTPGETGRQRLAQSARCQKPCECPDNKDVCDSLKAAARISQSALGTATGFNVPSGGAQTSEQVRKFKQEMGAALDKMAKDFCNMPQIPDMKKTLNSIDASQPRAVSERLKIAQIDRILDEMIAQLCGPPPEPPKTEPKKKKCADGSDPDPGSEQAVEQIKGGLKEAIKQAEEELQGSDKIKKLKDLQKALDFWSQIKSAGCVPDNVLSLVKLVKDGRDDLCMDMCHETAKWVAEMSGNPSMESTFFKACGLGCVGGD